MHPTLQSLLPLVSCATFDGINAEQALSLALLPDEHTLDLLALARITSASHEKKRITAAMASATTPFFTCGIISAKTGRCSENCAFCAQSSHYSTGSPVHPLVAFETLYERAAELAHNGVDRFGIVTSGHRLTERELDLLCENALRLRGAFPSLRLCASLGRLEDERAVKLRQAGFSRYHHNVETAASHYESICTTHAYEERITTVRTALRAGLSVCSGGIFGLGESWQQRIEMALTLKAEGVHALPLNFLHAIPGTPLEAQPKLQPAEALRCIALMRLMLPAKDLLICGGREHVFGAFQTYLAMAGANGLMVGNYLTTKGSSLETDRSMFRQLGLVDVMQEHPA